MNFISEDNKYELDNVDFKHNLISVWIEDQYVVFNWVGNVRFFTDSNGVGDTWIDYDQDIRLNIVLELSDCDVKLDNLNEVHIIEFIVQQFFKEKGDEYENC